MTRPATAARGAILAVALAGLAATGSDAAAQQPGPHPEVPSAGVAAENGPASMWVNPANMGYDPDPRLGVLVTGVPGDDAAPTSVAVTAGVDGLSLGVSNHRRLDGDGFASDWSLDYGTSLALPQRLSLGVLLGWHLVDGGTNWVGYDLGVAWRPLPWLGIGGVAQNVGDPDPDGRAVPRSAAGFALRPLGSFAVLGAEVVHQAGPDPAAPEENVDLGVITARVRPLEGLYLRGSAETRISPDGLEPVRFGAGLEFYFGGVGAGAHVSGDGTQPGLATLMLGTDEPGESLVRSGRRVPVLELERVPAYQPRSGPFGSEGPSWLDTLELLRRSEDDPGVRGLVLVLGQSSLPLGRAVELRERLERMEARGKPVLVYLTGSPSNADYFVASAASRVALHPAADLELTGLSMEMMHLRGLLDLVGVEPQFVRRSSYKSAPEQYTQTGPSPAAIEMYEALLDETFEVFVDGIQRGRDKDRAVVQGWIDGGPWSAAEAIDAGLVDTLLYPDQLEAELEQLHGGTVTRTELADMPQPRSAWEDPKQIGLVYVEGPIVSGESSRGGLLSGRSTGSKSVVDALDRARRDPQVRSVVLRVDSPGGSSFASDEIWRAVERLQEAEKPVVVSMGSVAASGGYYVSAGADAIWAEPTTLTGSIGVFSGKFSTREIQERLGVSTTSLGRGRNASIQSSAVPWDDVQRARMQQLVDQTYGQFKDRVAEGRTLTAEQVEDVAQGRVWSGAQAAELGLVDGLGGFQDAIADARERAGIPEGRKVGLVTFGDRGGVFESLAPSIAARISSRLGARAPLAELDALRGLLAPMDPLWVPALHPEEHVWMMDPWSVEVEAR